MTVTALIISLTAWSNALPKLKVVSSGTKA